MNSIILTVLARKYVSLLIMVSMVVLLFITNAAQAAIIISEIMYNPSSTEDDWEWIELYNSGSSEIDLTGYVIDDDDGTAYTSANIANGSILAGETAVLFNADDLTAADFEAAWRIGINLINVTNWGSMQLNNTGDKVSLWDSFASYKDDDTTHNNAIDTVAYDDSSPWPANDGSSSIYLNDLNADNNDGSNWALSQVDVSTPTGTAYQSSETGGNSGSDIGSPGGSSSVTITVTLEHDFDGGMASPGTPNVPFLQLGVQTDSGTANITSVSAVFTDTSSAVNADISAFDVYQDVDGDKTLDNLLGTDPNPDLKGSGATVTGLSFSVTTTKQYLILALDIDSNAVPSHKAGLKLLDSSFITSSDGTVVFDSEPIMNSLDKSLPVELSSLSATSKKKSVVLRWHTESETNNLGFNIYRSEEKDGKFTAVAFVRGAGTTGMRTDYEFKDINVEPGETYYYYLEDVDIFGITDKSRIVNVVVTPAKTMVIPTEFALLQNFPNPFNPETWIPYELAKEAPVSIIIYDATGHFVKRLDLGNRRSGYYLTQNKAAYWDGRNARGEKVASGIYWYTLRAGEFDATRRMVVMK